MQISRMATESGFTEMLGDAVKWQRDKSVHSDIAVYQNSKKLLGFRPTRSAYVAAWSTTTGTHQVCQMASFSSILALKIIRNVLISVE